MADVIVNGSCGPSFAQRLTIRRLEDRYGSDAFAPWVVHDGGHITGVLNGRIRFLTVLRDGRVSQNPRHPVLTDDELAWINA